MHENETIEALGDAETADFDEAIGHDDVADLSEIVDLDDTAGRNDDLHVPIRWIIPCVQIISATHGSESIASYGESPDLTSEVTKICRAFHREVTSDTVAKETPVYLFWQARSTGDWIVAQIKASQNAESPSGTLDYYCLVFDSHTFHVLRYNPFRLQSLNLYAQLRSHTLAGRTDVFRCTIPRRYVPTSMPFRADAPKPFLVKRIPGLSSRLSAHDNLRALEEFCFRWTENPTPPPTFATLWGNDTAAPDCFDIVLRSSDAAPGELRIAKKSLDRFVSQLTEAIFRVSPPSDAVGSLAQYARRAIGDAEEALARANVAFETGSQLQLKNDLQEAARHLECLGVRFQTYIAEVDSTAPGEVALPIPWLTQYAGEMATMIREISYQDATIWEQPPPTFPRPRLPKFTNPFSNARYRR